MRDWQLGAQLGRGGFGAVFRAARSSDGAIAAVKVATENDQLATLQLRAEAEALAEIGAPTVPNMLEDGSGHESPFLAMELIEERTLEQLTAAGPLPIDGVAMLGDKLLEALAQVHARGFVWRDLKPANVFAGLSPARVRLFDFGLARRIAAPEAPLVDEGLLARAGTPEYQAPEQSAGLAVDLRADLYSAGAVLYALLAGRPPFIGTAAEVKQAHLGLRPPRPSRVSGNSCPEVLEDVALRALAKDPAQRFASCAEMRAAWMVGMQTIAGQAGRTPVPSSLARPLPHARANALPAMERCSAGLVYFSAALDPAAVQSEVERAGAVLGNAAPPRYVALVAHERTDHPVREALAVAQALCARGLTERAVVDIAQVVVQRRGRAPARFISTAFSQAARFVDDRAPLGPLLSEAAAALLPEVRTAPVHEIAEYRRPLSSTLASGETNIIPVERSPLVGRQEVLDTLVSSARTAVDGRRPGIAVVTSDPGMGKSRLCTALSEGLSSQFPAARVLELRAPEPVAGGPEALLRLLIDRLIDGGSDRTDRPRWVQARLEHLLASQGAQLAAELYPAVALALGLYAHDAPELRALAAAPGALRSLALRAAGELLRAHARVRPLCLIVDDGHQADDTALDALEYAALAEAQVPLWICVLCRPSFQSARKNFGERAAVAEHLTLNALEPRAAEELCRALLLPAMNFPAEAVQRLLQRTQGVPLLLVELIRGLKRDGLVRQTGPHSWVLETDQLDRFPDLPLVEWIASREFESLPPDLAAHARLVALLGAEVIPQEVEGVIAELERSGAGASLPLDARVGMRRLRAAGVLVPGVGDALRMRHNLVRDAVARAAPSDFKAAVHDAAFRFYSERGSAPELRRLPLLALHAAASGRRGPAAALYLELGARAMARHAYFESERANTRALELLESDELRLRLQALHARANMRYRIGRGDDALADFAAARALASELGEQGTLIELLLEEATALDWRNDFAASAMLVNSARSLSTTVKVSAPQRAALAAGEGRALLRQGDWSGAAFELERATGLAELCGDAGYETRVISLLLLQAVLPQLGRVEDCERVSQQAIALSRARGDQLHLGSAINNRRNLLVARKALADCIADQLAFMRIGRELGMVISEYFGEINLGEMLFQSGDEETARQHIERAVSIEERHPEVAPRPFASLLRARLLAAQHKVSEARSELSRIRAAVAQALREGRMSGQLSPSEAVLLDLVDLATRTASPEEWSELVVRSAKDSIEQEHLEVLELCARTAKREGRMAAAEESLRAARGAAQRIPNLFDARLNRLANELLEA